LNYILKNENAIYYECCYSCDNALFLKLGSDGFFITDGRYIQEARNALSSKFEVVQSNDLVKTAREILRKNRIKSLVYDPKQWQVESFKELQKCGISLKPKKDFSWIKRAIKNDEEVSFIQKAIHLADAAFEQFSSEVVCGMDEYELNFLAKKCLSYSGKNELSFPPIVAIGANASKPHATPSDRKLQKNNLLLLDAGLKYKRYCSDKTRTAFYDGSLDFGYKQSFPNKKMQKAYDAVLKAHDEVVQKARVGMRAKELDKIARDIIEKSGFGEFFIHSTGHGVGLDIHEMPFIHSKSETIIEENMVFTIEPGIYIPNAFGIRIEDIVVMQKDKAQIL